MFKNKEDISENTIMVLNKATTLYEIFKELDIKINLKTNDVSILSDNISRNDKRLLSIFVAMFYVECGAKKILEDFNISLNNVLDLILIDSGEDKYVFEPSQLARLIFHNKKDEINKDLETIIRDMLNDFGYLSTEGLLVLMYDTVYSASRLIGLLLPCILEECSPFSDEKAFYKMLVRKANEIEQEKSQEIPFIREKIEKLNTKYSDNFLAFLNVNNDNDNVSNVLLENYGKYLTDIHFDSNPAIGRERELEKAKVSLLTKDKSLILVGDGGVGKTAIVEGLAYDIQKGKVPNALKNKKILSINTNDLVSGCKYVGTFEKVVKNLFEQIENDKNIILFIDEIHTVFGLGAGSNATLDFANILKPYLGRGNIKMIGATTKEEYEEIITRDSAFKRRFERLDIKEPDNELLFKIMNEVILKFEKNYNIKFLNSDKERGIVLKEIVNTTEKAKRIYTDRSSNPDLVILIIEKAFAYAVYNQHEYVNKDDIIRAIMDCDRIYESVRVEAKDNLQRKLERESNSKEKIKVIDFNKFKR